ncbi:MAG TPA: M48 family metallopeptidase [Acidimicrobiia bacterium]
MEVELVVGTRRRRHVEGVLVGDVLRVAYPPRMSRAEAERIAQELRARMERRVASDRLDLAARARALARRYELPLPVRVEWSDRQQARWGSCDPADGFIRVSRRLAAFPTWVLDYVIVHELAHLAVPDHGPRFHALVARYPRAERAVGFLIAKDLGPDEPDPSPVDVDVDLDLTEAADHGDAIEATGGIAGVADLGVPELGVADVAADAT